MKKSAKPIFIKPGAIGYKLPIHGSVTFFLILKCWGSDVPEWFLGILWFCFLILWLISLYMIWGQIGQQVNPLDTYNQDAHPLDAYNQDNGIKKTASCFKDKLKANLEAKEKS